MREVVLVRHGVTAWNVEGRIQGQGGQGLSDDGHEQARLTAAWLAETFPDATYFSSDLQRCRETVAPLVDEAGVHVQYREELRERHFGDWTSHTHREVSDGWPEKWARWRQGEDVTAEVGGESTGALTDRVVDFVGEVVDGLADGEAAVLVTHGGPIWNGVHALVELPLGSLGGVGNASVTVLHQSHHTAQLALWNQVGHLPPRLRSWFRAGRPSSDG